MYKNYIGNFVNFNRISNKRIDEFCLKHEKKRINFCINQENIGIDWNIKLDK